MTRKGMKPAGARRPMGSGAGARALAGVCVLGLALLLLNAPGAFGEDGKPSQLDRLRENWQARKSLIAHFAQTQVFAGFDEPLESTGTLRLLRPSFFEIRFDPPSRQLQVCDGASVWTYVPEQKQVVKATLSPEATRSADLLDWALEGATLIASASDDSMGDDGVRLVVKPGPQLPLGGLTVWMRAKDAALLGYEAIDAEGNRTRMRILDLLPGKGLKPADFAFRPPSGVEVIEVGGNR